MFLLLIAVSFLFEIVPINGITEYFCNEEMSCISSTIDVYQHLRCYGYKSCAFGSVKGYAMTCNGVQSCYECELAEGRHGYGNYALGTLSSAFTTSLLDGYKVWCYGEWSCLGAIDLYVSSSWATSDSQIFCLGLGSCAHSSITRHSANTQVTGYGAFSLYNSTIFASGSGWELNLYLGGYFAGYNGVFYCESYATCSVTCQASGCYNFEFICDGSADCSVSCNGSNTDASTMLVNICPNEWYSNPIDSLNSVSISDIGAISAIQKWIDFWLASSNSNYSLVPVYEKYVENTEFRVVHETCETKCADYQSCQTTQMVLDNHVVCCYAAASCQYANISIASEGKILCEGKSACIGSTLNSRNMFAGGQECAKNSDITFQHVAVCTGFGSCSSSIIKQGNILVCGGRYSCGSSRIIDVDCIYCIGMKCLQDTEIIVDGNQQYVTIYLAAQDAGLDMLINCTQNTNAIILVYCAIYNCVGMPIESQCIVLYLNSVISTTIHLRHS